MITTERGPLPGDWRAGAYGGNRKAHAFTFGLMQTRKAPACGARVKYDTYLAVRSRKSADLCYDCLAHEAGMAGATP